MESLTKETKSTTVGNLPLNKSQNVKVWGFTPGAETLNGPSGDAWICVCPITRILYWTGGSTLFSIFFKLL